MRGRTNDRLSVSLPCEDQISIYWSLKLIKVKQPLYGKSKTFPSLSLLSWSSSCHIVDAVYAPGLSSYSRHLGTFTTQSLYQVPSEQVDWLECSNQDHLTPEFPRFVHTGISNHLTISRNLGDPACAR